jgi:hypothetical protein
VWRAWRASRPISSARHSRASRFGYELLDERSSDEATQKAVANMNADLVRLDSRGAPLERIGRDPRRDSVDVPALVTRIGDYFRSRVPTLNNASPSTSLPASEQFDHPRRTLCTSSGRCGGAREERRRRTRAGRTHHPHECCIGRGRRLYNRCPDDGRAFPATCGVGFSSPVSRPESVGESVSRWPRRIVEENHDGNFGCCLADRGASFEIILP